MLRGMYTAVSGMINQQRKHDTITNNISNINTPGFKQGNAVSRSFPEVLISAMDASGNPSVRSVGRMNTGVLAEEDLSIYLQGDLQETGNALDVAIVSNIVRDANGNALPPFDNSGKNVSADGEKTFQPQAFLTLENANGDRRYSRNGKLTVNEAGELVTPEGYRVLSVSGQPVVLRDPNGQPIANVKITEGGQLLDALNGQPLQDANGDAVALLISRVENPNRMVREGNGVYRVNEEDEGAVTQTVMDEQVQLHQGYLERSNVDPTQSMVNMMAAARAYEMNQKIVQFYDKSLEKAVTEVGRV